MHAQSTKDAAMEQQTHDALNIYAVIQVLRGFSNEITVQKLAAQLNVSYSTLARCKSGSCPPSITYRSLKGAFDSYKDRYFQGDGKALVDASIDILHRRGCDTSFLEQEYATEGYQGFVNMLLGKALANSDQAKRASRSGAASGTAISAEAETPSAEDKGFSQVDAAHAMQSEPRNFSCADDAAAHKASMQNEPGRASGSAKSTGPEKDNYDTESEKGTFPSTHGMAGWIPLIMLVGVGLFQMPIGALLGWIGKHTLLFVGLSLLIAASPIVVGLCVDAPLAWARHRRRQPDAQLDRRTWQAVAKYGDPLRIVPGEGRFNASAAHCTYGLVCNVAGTLVAVSLFASLASLPGFLDYVNTHDWTEFFKVSMALGFFVAYRHTNLLQNMPRPSAHDERYNPDNYLYTRVHVWANIVHLVWVITLCGVFALCMLGYGVANFQRMELPLAVLWPVVQMTLFLLYANASPYAAHVQVSSAASLSSGLICLTLVMLGVTACYAPSWKTALALAIYTCIAVIALAWRKRMMGSPQSRIWLENSAASRSYGIVMVAALALMAAVGLATSAIL